MRGWWLCLFVLARLACAEPARSLTARQIRAIEELVQAERARQQIPGLTVAIGTPAGVIYEQGFGRADLENDVPATAATVYRLASVAKPMTAVALMQLVEAGQIDLDAALQTYLPRYPAKPWPITLRQLLCHQSGVRHYRDDADKNNTRHYDDLKAALELFADDPLLFEPGQQYSYTTYGYVVLGAVLEAVTGQRYLDVIRRRIWDPAGMTHTQDDNVYRLIRNRARGYFRPATGEMQNSPLVDTSSKIPGGGLSATAGDVVRFALAVDAGKLVSPDTLRLMWTPQVPPEGKDPHYGLGWSLGVFEGRRQVGHLGGQSGTSTIFVLLPDEHLAVAILCNVEQVQFPPLLDPLLRLLGKGAK